MKKKNKNSLVKRMLFTERFMVQSNVQPCQVPSNIQQENWSIGWNFISTQIAFCFSLNVYQEKQKKCIFFFKFCSWFKYVNPLFISIINLVDLVILEGAIYRSFFILSRELWLFSCAYKPVELEYSTRCMQLPYKGEISFYSPRFEKNK